MGYRHRVTIVRASGHNLVKNFVDIDPKTSEYCPRDRITSLIAKAIGWDKTIRIEIEETDTQLYGLPVARRTYQRAVILKDGRIFEFIGFDANYAHLYDGNLRSFHIG